MNDKLNMIWDYLIEREHFTADELELLINIMGWNEDTFNAAIYARYGYRDFEQFTEELGEPDNMDDFPQP